MAQRARPRPPLQPLLAGGVQRAAAPVRRALLAVRDEGKARGALQDVLLKLVADVRVELIQRT